MKRPVIFAAAAHIAAWIVLTIADYLDETTSSDLAYVLFFAGPALVSVIYLILRKKYGLKALFHGGRICLSGRGCG